MNKKLSKNRVEAILEFFEQENPNASTELFFSNPYELLVAVILSAQCTDKRVNMVTPDFFKRFPDVQTLSKSSAEEVFPYIKSISYPNNKANHLVGMASKVVAEYRGQIPNTVEALKTLPGVGQKTANVIVSVVFDTPAMPVDTHVFRVAARLGLTRNAKNPMQAEAQLLKVIPRNKLSVAHHWLILHGRYVCKARKPMCEKCGLTANCSYFAKEKSIALKTAKQKRRL